MNTRSSIDTRGRGASLVPGSLAVIAALVMLGNGASPFDGGSGTSRALAVVLPPFALGLAAAVLCRPSVAATVVALVGGALAGVGRGFVYDPVRDRACVRCLPSPMATHPDAHLADNAALVGGLLIAVALIVVVALHRSVWAAAGAAIVGVSTTAYNTPHGVYFGFVRALAAIAALSLASAAVHLAVAHRAMTRLTDALASGRSPDDVIKAQLRDPAAWVEFAGPSTSRDWVTEDGSPVPAGRTSGQATIVSARGRSVARIHHTLPLGTIGPELVLRLEQAGLAAGLAAQVAELASSRTRIVERADLERRQLERDLHDGAQQYLLALAVDLSLGARAVTDGARIALEDCRRDAEAALEELRTIARGVYPVLLAAGGLAPALQELSRRVGTRITVHGPARNVQLVQAATLYGLVEELATAKPTAVTVTVGDNSPLVVDITGGTVAVDSLHRERVAASGGKLEDMPSRIVVTFP